MDEKFYSVSEAARRAGVSEDELRCAIKDGRLEAATLPNTGAIQVREDQLQRYLGLSRKSESKKRVLIIDDEINFANIMKLELERDPRIEAKFATWGKDGVKMAETYAPDLCLVDFMLPDITGDEVIAALHARRDVQNSKVVVYSAHTRDAIRENPNLEERLQQLGAREFLSKSIGMRSLIAKVYEYLELESQTHAMRRPS